MVVGGEEARDIITMRFHWNYRQCKGIIHSQRSTFLYPIHVEDSDLA